jgi:hypothetical protein
VPRTHRLVATILRACASATCLRGTDPVGPGSRAAPEAPPFREPGGVPSPRSADPEEEAQLIRAGAGVPAGEIVGVRPDATPGLVPKRPPAAADPVRITSRSEAESLARSGAGTETDPWVIHHNRFTKTQGALCEEDAYEHVRPRGGCVVRHCVGDDVGGQIVDYFENHPENRGEIHDIYGSCRDRSVMVTDVDNVVVHDIFRDNTGGHMFNVLLEQRHAEPGLHPAGCTFYPPLPSDGSCFQGRVFGAWGVVGPGNEATWWENGELREFHS